MKSNMLPTNWDVIAHYHYVREKMMAEDAKFVNSKFSNFSEVKQEVISVTLNQYGPCQAWRLLATKGLKKG